MTIKKARVVSFKIFVLNVVTVKQQSRVSKVGLDFTSLAAVQSLMF